MTSITARLSRVQKALKAPKSQTNTFGKYKYRNCEDILEALKPLLQDDETVIISDEIVFYGQNPSKRETDGDVFNDKNEVIGQQQTSTVYGDRFYIKATATFYADGSSISSSALAREPFEKKGMDASQVTGATSSYARKYALNGLLLIDDTKDADATNTGKEDEVKETTHQEKPKEKVNWKSVQTNLANLMNLSKTPVELDKIMEENNDDIQAMPPEFADFINTLYDSLKEGGPLESPVLKFASVGDAADWAGKRFKELNEIGTLSDLAEFEDKYMPYLIKTGQKKDKPSTLDQSLNAAKHIIDGKTPSDRMIEKFQFALKVLQSQQG